MLAGQLVSNCEICRWRNIADADGVRVGSRVYTVFNTSGNSFRLLTEIFYEDQTILIRHVRTHAEYDKGAWKK